MGSWQTCVRARTDVHALILTVKDLKELVTRKPAAEVELRAGQKPCIMLCVCSAHFHEIPALHLHTVIHVCMHQAHDAAQELPN